MYVCYVCIYISSYYNKIWTVPKMTKQRPANILCISVFVYIYIYIIETKIAEKIPNPPPLQKKNFVTVHVPHGLTQPPHSSFQHPSHIKPSQISGDSRCIWCARFTVSSQWLRTRRTKPRRTSSSEQSSTRTWEAGHKRGVSLSSCGYVTWCCMISFCTYMPYIYAYRYTCIYIYCIYHTYIHCIYVYVK